MYASNKQNFNCNIKYEGTVRNESENYSYKTSFKGSYSYVIRPLYDLYLSIMAVRLYTSRC